MPISPSTVIPAEAMPAGRRAGIHTKRFSEPKSGMTKGKGFTLIELLVVISILAILSVIGFVAFGNVQKGARDAKRRTDIDAITKALEVHFGQYSNGAYSGICQDSATPTYTGCGSWFSGGIVPQDPLGNSQRKYCMWANNIPGNTLADPSPWTATNCPDPNYGDEAVAGKPIVANNAVWKICASLEATSAVYCRHAQQ